MGGKSSKPAPAAPTQQVQTPDVDVAQVAAEKALAAQGNILASTQGESEDQKKQQTQQQQLGQTKASPPPRRPRDAASVANAMPQGGMSTSAVLTG